MNRDDSLNWFHGKISRERAEELLENEGENGAFLVRESNTSPNDYVLSVINNNEVVHYQIRRHGEDAFFSIEDNTTVHGLDILIDHYKSESSGLITRLTTACKGQPPPNGTRTHGTTNLLHRATEAGDLNVVSEMLKCGYRSRDAKNQDGQTAVHIAARDGKDDILETLIKSGATVNIRDTMGFTPLHYTCKNNLPSTTELLITEGKANAQLRHTISGRVPLHEAAQRGHIECIKVLLRFRAAINPRTLALETPADLAYNAGYMDCYNLLKSRRSVIVTEKNAWYHGTLSRAEAESVLRSTFPQRPPPSGAFLVRYSQRQAAHYVLTLIYEDTLYNYIIQKKDEWHFIDDGPLFESFEALIGHYSYFLDGLPCRLTTPVHAQPKPPLPECSTMPRIKKNKTQGTSPIKKQNSIPAERSPPELPAPNSNKNNSLEQLARNLSFSLDFNSSLEICDSDNTDETYKVPTSINNNNMILSETDGKFFDCNGHAIIQDFISFKQLTLGQVLGEGEFGSVLKATYTQPDGKTIDVAVKTLHSQHVDSCTNEFYAEARVMMSLNHPCIVKLIGVSQGPPLAMVQELVALGSLLKYLISEGIGARSLRQAWASQVARGMAYLEARRLVHRDLAARNILLATRYQTKISDFGLSRSLSNDSSYYRASRGGQWPIKWYAPESYNYGTFSHASDVWSYGVTLWEIFTYGEQPYGEMRGAEAIQFVEDGNRLEKPDDCSDDIYELMLRCWAYDSAARPSFRVILATIDDTSTTSGC